MTRTKHKTRVLQEWHQLLGSFCQTSSPILASETPRHPNITWHLTQDCIAIRERMRAAIGLRDDTIDHWRIRRLIYLARTGPPTTYHRHNDFWTILGLKSSRSQKNSEQFTVTVLAGFSQEFPLCTTSTLVTSQYRHHPPLKCSFSLFTISVCI